MNAKPTYSLVSTSQPVRAVQDEWGLFDPDQAGMTAAIRASNQIQHPKKPAEVAAPVSAARADNDEVYELPSPAPQAKANANADHGAVYSLEFPTHCPQCCKSIKTLRVFRLLRTQVSFTSTLPRKGYIIVCPECNGVLSAELSGLI